MKRLFFSFLSATFLLLCVPPDNVSALASYKVLVVMSYGLDHDFEQEIRQGIDSVLRDHSNTKYIYLGTKKNIASGPQKAREAYELYKKFKPDGVIAVDDNAQAMFVVPYLKDKVKTPVMFCGVNAEPEIYGYPASNVSGILERVPISQSLAFAKQLMPDIKTFGYMALDSPTGRSILNYLQHEVDTMPLKLASIQLPATMAETRKLIAGINQEIDIWYVPTMQGIKDDNGIPLTHKQIVPILADTFTRPLLGDHKDIIKYGMLCGMTLVGQEQGSTAAEMLLKAMTGTPISKLPITRNKKGNPVINVTVMKQLGIKPKPILLKDAELVRTEL